MIPLKKIELRRSVDIVDCGPYFRVDFRDRFVRDNVLPVSRTIRSHERFPDLKGVLWDLRTADLSELTLEQLVDVMRSQDGPHPAKRLKVALVVESVYDVCIIKLWEHVGEDGTPNVRRWFADEESALTWIME